MKSRADYVQMCLSKIKREIPEPNRSLLLEFYKSMKVDRLTDGRILEYMRCLYEIAGMRKKPFREYTQKDVMNVLFRYENARYSRNGTSRPYSYNTILGVKISLKKLFKWLNGDGTYPDCVKHMVCSSNRAPKIRPEDVLTPVDIKRMADACDQLRDKALIQVFYESGCRSIEIWNLRRKNIDFDKFGAIITVKSAKTRDEYRRVRVVFSAPDLANWLRVLPQKSPEAHVWVGIGTRNRGRLITQGEISHVLKVAARKAGVQKRVWPHLMRHSRATAMASRTTETMMRKYFGWSRTSDMPSHYSHLSGKQVDDAILEMYGIRKPENEGDNLVAVVCPRCSVQNSPANFCARCGFPLNEKAADWADMRVESAAHFVKEMLTDEKIQRVLKQKMMEFFASNPQGPPANLSLPPPSRQMHDSQAV